LIHIGNLEGRPGEHTFGYLEITRSRSGLSPDVPVHLFVGRKPGPTLLVQGAIHGTEIIGTIAILNFVRKLDPTKLRGTVIAVPVVNRVGFELSERVSRIDNKDISHLFPGRLEGSLSDQIAYVYFHEVIKRANVMVDFHQGGLASYERYVIFTAERDPNNPTPLEQKRRKLVVAFGLDAAAFFPPGTFKENQSEVIEDAGVIQFGLELGGGTGWYKNGQENVYAGERGIWNILKAMRMIDGDFEADGPLCTVYNAGVVFWKPPVEGLYIRKKGFGELVKENEIFGTMVDPYTGRLLFSIRNQTEATVIPGGREWPTISSTTVGILGLVDRVEDRRTADLYVSFD
jgi:predicted deacylase